MRLRCEGCRTCTPELIPPSQYDGIYDKLCDSQLTDRQIEELSKPLFNGELMILNCLKRDLKILCVIKSTRVGLWRWDK